MFARKSIGAVNQRQMKFRQMKFVKWSSTNKVSPKKSLADKNAIGVASGKPGEKEKAKWRFAKEFPQIKFKSFFFCI